MARNRKGTGNPRPYVTPPAVRTLAGWVGGSLRRLPVRGVPGVILVGVGLVAVLVVPAAAAPAGVAHAKVTGSSPADGALVDRAPDTVELSVDAKPATIEGDPLRVYGPGGRRLDDGRTVVRDGGRRISIGLDPTVDRPAGRYEIVYRIVSADTHLIAGRLSFETRAGVPAVALARNPDGSGATRVGRLLHGWPMQPWPPLAAGGAFVLAALRLGWRRRRATAAARRPMLPPMQGHLVATRTAYRPRPQPPSTGPPPRPTAHHPQRVDRVRPQ